MTVHTATQQASYRQRLGYQGALLAGICTIVGALIVIGNSVTQVPIADALMKDKLDMLSQVLPPERYNNPLLDEAVSLAEIPGHNPVYVAKHDDQLVGFAFSTSSKGYSGEINLIMGLDQHSTIIGVRVVEHAETPGLGDRIEIAKDPWITGFNGLSLSNTSASQWAVKKDGGQFDQFTGATITPRAVVKAVHEGLIFFAENRHRITDLATTQSQPSGNSHD